VHVRSAIDRLEVPRGEKAPDVALAGELAAMGLL
jgi:hypothetical protein